MKALPLKIYPLLPSDMYYTQSYVIVYSYSIKDYYTINCSPGLFHPNIVFIPVKLKIKI